MIKIIKNSSTLLLVIAVLAGFLYGARYISNNFATRQELPVNVTNEAEITNEAMVVEDDGMQVMEESVQVDSVTYVAQEDDQNAFDLLKQNAEVEYDEYDFGVFVKSINGIVGDEKYFWAFYVNGEKANQGADATTLNSGDEVEWRYEEVIY